MNSSLRIYLCAFCSLLLTPFSSIVSLPVSASWVPLTAGLSRICLTCLSQSLPAALPLAYYLHLVMFPKALS